MTKGLRNIKMVREFECKDKVVFLRLDLNVPIEDGKITDETRIVAALPTIQFLMDQGAKIVMASHLGRPKTAADKEFSLEPVATRLAEHLKAEVLLLENCSSDGVRGLLVGIKKDQLILLENLRFEPGETKDSEELAQDMASYTDIYINDAFGASHRAHASIHALPKLLKEKGVGFLIEKEITMLDKLIDDPARPYIAVLGGAKVSDKIAVIEKLMDIVDGIIIGGAMAYTFLKAQGHAVGKSLIEQDKIKYAKEMIERIDARKKSLHLPVDHLAARSLKDPSSTVVTKDANIREDFMGVDIGPQTLSKYAAVLKEAKTIFWNGPMGVFETPEFSKGTFGVAKAMAENTGMTIVGGGDSASAAEASGYAEKMTHISTGGGASLEYLQGDKLPGLEVYANVDRVRRYGGPMNKFVIGMLMIPTMSFAAPVAVPGAVAKAAAKMKSADVRTVVKMVSAAEESPCGLAGSYNVSLEVKTAQYDRMNNKTVYSWDKVKTINVEKSGQVMEVCAE